MTSHASRRTAHPERSSSFYTLIFITNICIIFLYIVSLYHVFQ
nr:MAG TPA: hypothetical protein [Caudoviricetes sp.]